MTIELTKDEIKNGWTAESLEKYHKERDKIAYTKILEPKKKRPVLQTRYDPTRWRE